MKVLNSTIPIINTYDPNNPSLQFTENATAAVEYLKQEYFFQFNLKVWYCLFSCHNSFKIYQITDLVPPDILEKVLSKEVFLLLDNALEPFVKSIDSIYENLVIKQNIPASQIIFFTNMHDETNFVLAQGFLIIKN